MFRGRNTVLGFSASALEPDTESVRRVGVSPVRELGASDRLFPFPNGLTSTKRKFTTGGHRENGTVLYAGQIAASVRA